MLCEGSPLLFYTPWGPVTPMGMYRRAPRLTYRTGEQTGEPRRATGPIASVLDYLAQAEIQAGQRSRPGGDPGQAEIQAWA